MPFTGARDSPKAGRTANRYTGQYDLPTWLYYVLSYGIILAIVVAGGYGTRALGVTLPPGRAWIGVALVIGLNVFAAIIFRTLPPGESVDLPAEDLAREISTPLSIFVLFLGLLFRAVLPEELVLRVGIQPRLNNFIPMLLLVHLFAFPCFGI